MSITFPATLAQQLSVQLSPMLADAGFELVDVELDSVGGGSVVRILVDLAQIEPDRRIDLEGVTHATRLINAHLDAADPIEQAFTLEVSSPGLERPLRTPVHFARFVGTEVSVKTVPGTPGDRRRTGILSAAESEPSGTITLTDRNGQHVIAYASIDRARTVFKWGEQIGTGETASGQPRKKGALPKGQRPVHPMAGGPSAQPDAHAQVLNAPAELGDEHGEDLDDDLADDLEEDFDEADDDLDETYDDDLDDDESDDDDDESDDDLDDDVHPEPGALASRSPRQMGCSTSGSTPIPPFTSQPRSQTTSITPQRLATPGHNARPTEHENPEVTS